MNDESDEDVELTKLAESYEKKGAQIVGFKSNDALVPKKNKPKAPKEKAEPKKRKSDVENRPLEVVGAEPSNLIEMNVSLSSAFHFVSVCCFQKRRRRSLMWKPWPWGHLWSNQAKADETCLMMGGIAMLSTILAFPLGLQKMRRNTFGRSCLSQKHWWKSIRRIFR